MLSMAAFLHISGSGKQFSSSIYVLLSKFTCNSLFESYFLWRVGGVLKPSLLLPSLHLDSENTFLTVNVW